MGSNILLYAFNEIFSLNNRSHQRQEFPTDNSPQFRPNPTCEFVWNSHVGKTEDLNAPVKWPSWEDQSRARICGRSATPSADYTP